MENNEGGERIVEVVTIVLNSNENIKRWEIVQRTGLL